jgi:hypothetical protein
MSEGTSAAAGNQLASAICVLSHDPSPARRLDAVKRIERIILSLCEWDIEIRRAGRERQLEELMQRPDWLRLSAGRVVSRLMRVEDRDDFGVASRSILAEILESLDIGHAALGNRVKKPDSDTWERLSEANAAAPAELRCSTVHAAKGAEFGAVLVALPAGLRRIDDRTLLTEP